MKIQFTFKHMESSKPLIDLAEEKFSSKIERLTSRPVHAHVTFSTQGLSNKIHVTLLTADGRDIEAEHEGEDMYTEIDIVAEKLEGQLRRHKEKQKTHDGATVRKLAVGGQYRVQDTDSQLDDDNVVNMDNAIDAGDILNFEKARQGTPLTPVCG